MKTNFHDKKFALSLAFIMRFKATQKWPICDYLENQTSTKGYSQEKGNFVPKELAINKPWMWLNIKCLVSSGIHTNTLAHKLFPYRNNC